MPHRQGWHHQQVPHTVPSLWAAQPHEWQDRGCHWWLNSTSQQVTAPIPCSIQRKKNFVAWDRGRARQGTTPLALYWFPTLRVSTLQHPAWSPVTPPPPPPSPPPSQEQYPEVTFELSKIVAKSLLEWRLPSQQALTGHGYSISVEISLKISGCQALVPNPLDPNLNPVQPSSNPNKPNRGLGLTL